MKVIDILNKIANGEEVPEKIKWRDRIWIYEKKEQDYNTYRNDIKIWFLNNFTNIRTKDFITDTVEIIEEQEEIDIRKLDFLVEYDSFEDYDCRDIGIAITKINEITKTINKMVDLIQQKNDKFKNIEIRLEQLDKKIKEKQ